MLTFLADRAGAISGYSDASPEVMPTVTEACFDIQTQLLTFFVTAIGTIRDAEKEESASHGKLWQRNIRCYIDRLIVYCLGNMGEHDGPWPQLRRQFTSTNESLLETLLRVERLVALYRPRPDYQDPLQRFRCAIMPPRNTPHFFDRIDVLEKIGEALGEPWPHTTFQAVALFGPGGIGKSSVAARYLETKLESGAYDTAFWIHGETTASLRQSFTDMALRLRLDGSHPNLHDNNLILVQSWLRSTGK